jgi:hypothetical protein
LRGLLATSVVRGIIADFARTESGRTAVDRRRADARRGGELSGRRRLIGARGYWLARPAKARQSPRAALQLRLKQIAPGIRGRRCGIRGRRLRPARAVWNRYCSREQQACSTQHALTARRRLPRSRSAHHRRPRHPGNCQSEPPSRSCAGASGPVRQPRDDRHGPPRGVPMVNGGRTDMVNGWLIAPTRALRSRARRRECGQAAQPDVQPLRS